MEANGLTAPGNAIGLAATVVLLRDSDDSGVEVLLLERPHDRGSFAGAWVFPGGAVDPADLIVAGAGPSIVESLLELPMGEEAAASRRAAARETREETGLLLDEDTLVPVSRWHPPRESPKPLRTWFYLAAAPSGPIALEPNEAVAHRWVSPEGALAMHAAGELTLFPPTWVTLFGLIGVPSSEDALRAARLQPIVEYATRFAPDRTVALWQADAAYGADGSVDPVLLDAPGPRHRLDMRELPWRYLHD
ncbi:NUDIX domain-containing protein [Microterricola gilva]|uniref:NUDIX domain-containing protein n=1 Tax=Microterricola gilva TaxID=393267 RepID=A0A4Q8AQI2_9MICO|nr:NUDIX domain-containing protein [Microterricola gilva]RZU66383.1 NUDIX domain-containing protein [Microterricola gilva]